MAVPDHYEKPSAAELDRLLTELNELGVARSTIPADDAAAAAEIDAAAADLRERITTLGNALEVYRERTLLRLEMEGLERRLRQPTGEEESSERLQLHDRMRFIRTRLARLEHDPTL